MCTVDPLTEPTMDICITDRWPSVIIVGVSIGWNLTVQDLLGL